jgi:dCMP deaminase
MSDRWHTRYLTKAFESAAFSKDRSTQVGAILFHPETRATLLSSYNGMVRGMNDDDEKFHERPLKYAVTEHAERNLLYFAARHGIRTDGLGIATTFYPCADCARGIVQSGLTQLVTVEPDWNHERWGESFKVAQLILDAGEIEVLTSKPVRRGELVVMPVRP